MFRGLYTATSGMMAHNRKQQVLTNNLSNANTPGFKQDQTVLRAFPAQLLSAMGKGTALQSGSQRIGTLNTGVYAQEGIPSFTQGALKETGNSTDISLMSELLPLNPESEQKGTIMYAVRTENGEVRYTQNGQFTVDQAGLLRTSDGHTVLGQDLTPINVISKEFTVQNDGQITLENGASAGSLWIGYTENSGQLVKEGQGLLRWDGAAEDAPQSVEDVPLLNDSATFVQQGFLEQSNVDLTTTMTEMMSTYRGFESNQKVIQAYDRSMEKAVNEIGRI
ncbi:flagellar hook-basal body protein [Planomicrobium sp. CPCC 101110]|uniref:flagellar hook-basal body protein n=1 Tax=Planomicrobium sp. CPCC 101110 TaxID=2599619 RepID=UPI0011B6E8B7|nr:flagellar hook-basal body protein [Planomicrobium sp. CPCC 101110]TWT27821.1 flagellar hook-basal body protein [Planomicrobium sp. CPCC 101110]